MPIVSDLGSLCFRDAVKGCEPYVDSLRFRLETQTLPVEQSRRRCEIILGVARVCHKLARASQDPRRHTDNLAINQQLDSILRHNLYTKYTTWTITIQK